MPHVTEKNDPDKLLSQIIDGLSYVDESTDPVAIATTTLDELQALRAALAAVVPAEAVAELVAEAEKNIALWRGDPNVQPGSLVGLIRRLVSALSASSRPAPSDDELRAAYITGRDEAREIAKVEGRDWRGARDFAHDEGLRAVAAVFLVVEDQP